MELLLLVALIGYLIYLTYKISAVEEELQKLKNMFAGAPVAIPSRPPYEDAPAVSATTLIPPSPSFVPKAVQQHTPALYADAHMPSTDSESSGFIYWAKQDFLVKVGALLLLIAVGWFVSYAFINNWIGPVGRITLGLVAGAGVLMFGTFRMQNRPHQGAIFSVLGSAIIIMTIYAARGIYDFFTPTSALVIMFLSITLVAFSSVRYRQVHMAVASLMLGAVLPHLTNAPTLDVIGVSLYLLVLVMGTLWVVYYLRVSILPFLALGVVGLYGMSYINTGVAEDKFMGLMFSFLFVGLFFVANVVSTLVYQPRPNDTMHYLTALGTGVYLLAWIMIAGPEAWQAPLLLFWMMVFSVGSFAVYTQTNNRLPFYMYGSVALALLAAATAEMFDGAVLTIMYAIEICALIVIANSIVRNSNVARSLSLLYVGLGILSLEHMVALTGYGTFSPSDAFALVIVAGSLLVSGLSLASTKPDITEKEQSPVGEVLLVGSLVYIFVLIWLQLHVMLTAGVAVSISLITYMMVGLGLYLTGRLSHAPSMKKVGMFIIGGVVLRLLIVDVWTLEITQRIIVFFIAGLLLLSTAFIKKKN